MLLLEGLHLCSTNHNSAERTTLPYQRHGEDAAMPIPSCNLPSTCEFITSALQVSDLDGLACRKRSAPPQWNDQVETRAYA